MKVAPYVGAWIETIGLLPLIDESDTSHPTWVRGLKLVVVEIGLPCFRRTLRGCVD